MIVLLTESRPAADCYRVEDVDNKNVYNAAVIQDVGEVDGLNDELRALSITPGNIHYNLKSLHNNQIVTAGTGREEVCSLSQELLSNSPFRK